MALAAPFQKDFMLKDEISIWDALRIWLSAIAEMAENNGVHPEGRYYLHNLRDTFLLEFGDEIKPFLGDVKVPSPYCAD